MGSSPWALLTSLGAMTAVIMLVFKDTILGFVASIQIAAYDMVRKGDWIEMPKYGADGDVIDISINTVKVQNWDKTITSLPTYSLISDSFKNWRGMSEGDGRRIKRSVIVDMNTIKFCDEAMVQKFSNIGLIKDYMATKSKEIEAYNKDNSIDKTQIINGRHLTNLGTYREYIKAYLKSNPQINRNMTFLVRQLASSEKGLPIEIYIFSSDKNWVNYEAIQADIFDHLLAAASEFGLKVFQSPSGNDLVKLKKAS